MYAVFQRGDRSLVAIQDFEHTVTSDSRTLYFDGTIDGLIGENYIVNRNIELGDVVSDLPRFLPALSGRYAGISLQDGRLEFAASDIGAVDELYYTTTDAELVLSTNFFALAKAVGRLDYDEREALFFII